MAIPLAAIKDKHKLRPEDLEKYFSKKNVKPGSKAEKLINDTAAIIRNGINRNRQDYRLYKSMDWAMDTPFYQVGYTQLRGLLNSDPDDNKVREAVNQWGLTHLLPDMLDANGNVCCGANKKPIKALNLPVFFNIFVPIVMAYITIRWAKLFNDRNLIPFYKYEPVVFTQDNRVRCEIITQLVQRQSTWFDYPADLRQSILQTLTYGFCINFPRESWFTETQEDDQGKDKIIKEGLRWNIPHPSRTYYDLYHRLSSLNNNSGCEYAGYWDLCRYADIKNNELYWNRDSITVGSTPDWLGGNNSDFLQQVYPCVMTFPSTTGGVGDLDREKAAARSYGEGDFDAATLRTQHFQRIVPKDHGMGTYPHPLWFRIVMANDSTVIWAEPLAFNVLPTYTYDADFNKARFRSLALEIMPFQDHISNVLSQWILSVKENLVNPVFYDQEKIPTTYINQIQNLGQKLNNGRPFIPFKGTENFRYKDGQKEAFFCPQLTHHNTAELVQLVTGILNMLDRVMQLSPQEIGQAAPHEQTAEESRIIAGNTSTRVAFTGSHIDAGDYAKKLAIYDATMAHADNDITVGITSAFASTQAEFDKLLKKVGFELTDKEQGFSPDKPEMMHTVKGNKSALTMESFVSTRDNQSRINLPAIADAMSKLFIAVSSSEPLIASIGPQQMVELFNQILVTSGLPPEFRLKGKPVTTQPPEQQAQEVQQMMKDFAGQVQQLVAQRQQETLAAAAKQTEQIVGQAAAAAQQQTAQAISQVAQQAAPAIEQVQQEAQAVTQKVVEHEQQIQALSQAVAQVMQVLQPVSAQPAV